MSVRADLLAGLAGRLADRADTAGHPLRVGVDGVCGAGKTTFADDLVAALGARGHPAVHLDSDGFHHVRARRHRNSDDPARGYYDDAYDLDSLAATVLRPLGPGGSRRYATKVHDLATDLLVDDAWATAPSDAVVVYAATFLQVAALDGLWDEVVYLDADPDAALARGVARDAAALGGAASARAAYRERYLAACRLYLRERDPRARASIVVEHTDPAAPRVLDESAPVEGSERT